MAYRVSALLLFFLTACSGGGGSPVLSGPVPVTPTLVAIGDSITADNYKAFPSYPAVVARDLGLHEVNLSVPGISAVGWLAQQAPLLPPNAAVILVNLGTNDAAIGLTDAFKAAYASILSAVKASSPNARVVLLNVRQFSDATTIGTVNAYINAEPYPVVNLHDAAAMYDPANMSDSVHPNTAGDAVIAVMVEAALH